MLSSNRLRSSGSPQISATSPADEEVNLERHLRENQRKLSFLEKQGKQISRPNYRDKMFLNQKQIKELQTDGTCDYNFLSEKQTSSIKRLLNSPTLHEDISSECVAGTCDHDSLPERASLKQQVVYHVQHAIKDAQENKTAATNPPALNVRVCDANYVDKLKTGDQFSLKGFSHRSKIDQNGDGYFKILRAKSISKGKKLVYIKQHQDVLDVSALSDLPWEDEIIGKCGSEFILEDKFQVKKKAKEGYEFDLTIACIRSLNSSPILKGNLSEDDVDDDELQL